MKPAIDDREAWIQLWKRRRREVDKTPMDVPICGDDLELDFIRDCPAELPIVLELACLDLIDRQRRGTDVRVEDYVMLHPKLEQTDLMLDLLDAEICVREEVGRSLSINLWRQRFPGLERQIRSLLELEQSGAAIFGGDAEFSVDDFSLNLPTETPKALANVTDKTPLRLDEPASRICDVDLADIESPSWFVPQRMIASGPRHWILRGRHIDDDRRFALKIIELGEPMSPACVDAVIDNLATGSGLATNVWVECESASAGRRRVVALRRWIEGIPYREWIASPSQQIRALVCVGQAIAAGHLAGVAHGGVHDDNILIDHHEQVRLVDGGVSRGGMPLKTPVTPFDARQLLADLKNADVRGLVSLIGRLTPEPTMDQENWKQWMRHIHDLSLDHHAETALEISEALANANLGEHQAASQGSSKSTSQSLGRWFKRKC